MKNSLEGFFYLFTCFSFGFFFFVLECLSPLSLNIHHLFEFPAAPTVSIKEIKGRKSLEFVSLDWIQWDWTAESKSIDLLYHIFPCLHGKLLKEKLIHCLWFFFFSFYLCFRSLSANLRLDAYITNPSCGTLRWLEEKIVSYI